MDLFKLSGISGVGTGTGTTGILPTGLSGGTAAARSLSGLAGLPTTSMDSLWTMNQQQGQAMTQMLQILFKMMQNGGASAASGAGSGGYGGSDSGSGGGGGGGGVSGSGSSGNVGDIVNTDSGGGGSVTDPGPIVAGTDGMLEHANKMVGLEEHRNRAAIEKITGKSGIDPVDDPWCAAWAMNLEEQHGVMDLSGLGNRNHTQEIKEWSRDKGTWGKRGSYTPKPGDAVLFDLTGDGHSDHIGIVEKVANGKVYTIEGNAGDAVRKRSYSLGNHKIEGYVKAKGKPKPHEAPKPKPKPKPSTSSHHNLTA